MPVRGGATIERPLPKAQGRDQVHHPRLDRFRIGFQVDPPVRMQRRQVLELGQVVQRLGVTSVHLLHAEQGEIRLGLLGGPDQAADDLTLPQTEAPDL